jgi:chromosome segregation ATPase
MPKSDGSGETIQVKAPVIKRSSTPGPVETHTGFVAVHSIETSSGDTTSGGVIDTFTEAKPSRISSGSTTSGSKSGGGGGGSSSKPQKAETKKKSDVVDRYKEIDDKIDDIANSMNKASRAADRLWGSARLSQMTKVNAALKDEIHALEKKRKEAENYLKLDKQALRDTISSEANIKVSNNDFDANGNFTAYDEVLTNLYNQLNSAITSANADGNADEDEQEKIDKIQERIDKIKEAIDQYDETRELVEDLNNDIQDKIYEWQDNNYELLNYKLEFEIEINDSELELIEYYLDSTKDNVYKTAEAFGYMKGIVDTYNDSIAHQDSYVQ